MLDDNYFNRASWEIGLKRFAPEVLTEGMELRILPLRKGLSYLYPQNVLAGIRSKRGAFRCKSYQGSPRIRSKSEFLA